MQQDSATRSEERRQATLGVDLGAPWLRRLHWAVARLGTAFSECLERELVERAGFNWLAVAFGAGCLVYFVLPREPVFAVLLVAAAAAAIVATLRYRQGAGWRVAAVVALCLSGAATAKWRVDRIAGPQLERAVSTELTGRVVGREIRLERRPRITLDGVDARNIDPGDTPRRIRVTLPAKHGLPPLGARISMRARLAPVPGPVVPGGYDPRRAAFFDGIGAGGFALGGWQLTAPPPPWSFDLAVAEIRAAAVARIMAIEPGEAGAVAAALLVGERSALSTETNESLRISGLAHILSISGLHMMLIAGTAFFVTRAALALSPRLALSWPIRKWAAVAALLVVSVYFALSGGGAATVRSYVMAAIVFGAILIDRPPIAMRNLALAAFVVLALEPESVVEPGFQMSFAAVASLISAWRVWQDMRRRRLTDADAVPGLWLLRFIGRAILGVALTTLVAGLATAPFAAYHFERVATYSLLGNLLAAPLVSVIIMPFGLLTLVAMPLGLEALPLAIMARGIDMLLVVSGWVAQIPGADVRAPPIAPATLLLITVGMLWLCLWRERWRYGGLAPICLGFALVPLLADRPDILVAPEGDAVAARDATGVLRVSGSRAGSYTIEQFFDEEPTRSPDAVALREGIRCDPLACLLPARGGIVVSHVVDPAAFLEDCRRADVVVTALAAPPDCGATLVIDATNLARSGSHAVRIRKASGTPVYAITTERSRFQRPWQAGGTYPANAAGISISAGGP